MKDYTGIYVSPHFERAEDGYRITGWKFELLKNGKLVTWGQGYDTPEEARQAAKEEERNGSGA